MRLHTSEELRNYCDALESSKRMGAKFWRDGYGIATKEEARAIPAGELNSYLRPAMRDLAVVLIGRLSVASDDVRRDIHKHLSNAFPTIKSFGFVIRKGPNARPTKAFSDCGDTTVTVQRDLENGETYSACVSWRYADVKDISDPTSVIPELIGEASQRGIDPIIAAPKSMGTRVDISYTPQVVGEIVHRSFWDGWKECAMMREVVSQELKSLALSACPGYDGPGPSLSRMFPIGGQATSEAVSASSRATSRATSRKGVTV